MNALRIRLKDGRFKMKLAVSATSRLHKLSEFLTIVVGIPYDLYKLG